MFKSKLNSFFRIDERGSIFKKEIIGGISTFLAAIYIISVEPNILGQAHSIHTNDSPMGSGGIFLATVLTIFIITMIMGLFANTPLVLAPSMAFNSMFAVNLANEGGLGYQGALISCLIGSILFFIVSITPLRQKVIQAIPSQLNIAIGVGIGFFISFVGLKQMGWVKTNDEQLPVAALNDMKQYYVVMLISAVALALMFTFHILKLKGGIIYAMLIAMVPVFLLANLDATKDLSVIAGDDKLGLATFHGWTYGEFDQFSINIKNSFKEFTNKDIWNTPVMYISIFMVVLLNFFIGNGSITVVYSQIKELDNKEIEVPKQVMWIDSGSSILGSVMGVSPTSIFVESTTGVAAGARTGLASVVTALLFALAIPLYPLFKLIPGVVTGATSVYIGSLMITQIKNINWNDYSVTVSSFLMMLFMVVTFNITNGIAVSILMYILLETVSKRGKKIHPLMWSLGVIFIAYFIAQAFIS